MGFLDSVLSIATTVGSTFLAATPAGQAINLIGGAIGGATGAAVARPGGLGGVAGLVGLAVSPEPPVATPTPTAGLLPAIGAVAARAAGGAIAAVAGGPIVTTGFGGGSGGFSTRTTVETMDLRTGSIVRTKTLPGSPFLMNSEILAAKRVFKKSAALERRIPHKTRKQSATSQLKDAAIDAALRHTLEDHHPKC